MFDLHPNTDRRWLLGWIAAFGLLVTTTLAHQARLRHVESIPVWSVTPAVADSTSPTGYTDGRRQWISPTREQETYGWIARTQHLFATGELRRGRIDWDNAPEGRADHAPTLYTLWIAGTAWLVHAVSEGSLALAAERAALWVRFAGKKSRIDLTFHVSRDRDAVDVSARVLIDDRSARLKLVFPAGDQVDYEVPASVVRRGPAGEVPGARWARVHGKNGGMGFASDALYNFDSEKGEFRATVARASRYANDVKTDEAAELWRPAVDCGELKFRFLVTSPTADLPRLASVLEQPPVVLFVPPREGKLKRTGSLLELTPGPVRLLALKRAEDGKGFILRAQALPGKAVKVTALWLGTKIVLGPLKGGEIGTWKIQSASNAWKALKVTATELQ
jgi:hypothetical protein